MFFSFSACHLVKKFIRTVMRANAIYSCPKDLNWKLKYDDNNFMEETGG